MGAAVVAKEVRMQARSVTVFGQPSSIRQELAATAIAQAAALEGCPAEEDLNILADSLSSVRLLMGMQQRGLPLSLSSYRHSVRCCGRTRAGAHWARCWGR
jgi:hypothetical protein